MSRKALAVVVLISAVWLTACGSTTPESMNPKRDIVGSWTCGSMNVTFAANDSVTYSGSPQGGISTKGSSSGASDFTDNTHIIGAWVLSLPSYEVHITGNTMVLKASDGSTETCTRK